MQFVKSLLAIAIASGALLTSAQSSVDGKWNLLWQARSGAQNGAVMNINGDKGDFKLQRNVVRGRPDPCDSVTAPITVTRDGDSVKLHVAYSQAMTGCPDRNLTLNPVGDKLEGSYDGSGIAVTATR
jgi:hypothetical protein